ncbi:Diatom spindle kinesin-1, partial [Durusdinium trenchii]
MQGSHRRLVFAFLLSVVTGATCSTSEGCEDDSPQLLQLQRQQQSFEAGVNEAAPLTLEDFQKQNACYDRASSDNWAVVDAHLHPRPFGGPPVAFTDLIGRMRRAGILFATLYGIGQRLPINSTCTYYLDCPGTKITPSLKNDFFNAQSVLDNAADLADPVGPHITLSMSFVDLHEPTANLEKIKLMQSEFPGMFKWVGEINLVKQALWPNSQGLPVRQESIKDWKPFMDEFRRQGLPLALHSDLGNEKNGEQFLPLMDKVLETYPDNKIIWVHMAGLSKQLNPQLASSLALLQRPVTIEDHVSMIEERLNKHPKLSIDLSWDILYDELYSSKSEERPYVNLINKYPSRFLSGSDHVASADKIEETYRNEVNKTSAIYRDLSDTAFRNIALGQNYFDLIGLNFTAPAICAPSLVGKEALRPRKPQSLITMSQARPANKSSQLQKAGRAGSSRFPDLSVLQTSLTVDDFKQGSSTCFDRNTSDQWAVVDAHLHARPFGGPPVPFHELMDRLRRAGILFTTLYGIGQRLPIDSNCTYYLDCPGTPVKPSLKNDFFNAQTVLDSSELLEAGPVVTLSMSFFDLQKPETILPNMALLQREFPGMFTWVGEINLVKQALWNNSQGKPVPIESILRWAEFMAELRRQDIPMAIHMDLGNEKNGRQFLPLMDKVLETYPDNKIIWVHMAGLSKQLNPKLALLQLPVTIQNHVKVIQDRLEKYPNLFIDLSWDVLYDNIYHDDAEEQPYIALINNYPTRFLSGSDHVAAASKTEAGYRSELAKTNSIYRKLNDEAFRNIALGGTYFKLARLNQYRPPPLCNLQTG